MKQERKWVDPKGAEIPERFITPQQKVVEGAVRKIANRAKALQKALQEAKLMMIAACESVWRKTPESERSQSLTFYSFSREYKIEYSNKEKSVRVYEATKANPSAKDYKMIDLSLNSSKILSAIATGEVEPEKGLALPKDFVEPKDLAVIVKETTAAVFDKPDVPDENETPNDTHSSPYRHTAYPTPSDDTDSSVQNEEAEEEETVHDLRSEDSDGPGESGTLFPR